MKSFAGWVYTGKNKEKAFIQPKLTVSDSKYPSFIERILTRRGIKREEFENFLEPDPEKLFPYRKWENLLRARDLILWAIKNKKKIHIHSDYDVDGITSLSMLCAGIKHFGGFFTYSISNRFKGGYGISDELFENCITNGCQLFISLDCGTSSYLIHQKAKKCQIPLLIIDHHPPMEKVDEWVTLCNTHLKDCPTPLKKLSSAGIVFKLLEGLYESFELKFPYKSFLRLTALGLAQDIVEMLGENHALVSLGMKEIPQTKNLFLKELLKVTGLYGKPINSTHLYFRLGPRINAPGRMDDATFLVDLFLYPDKRKVMEGIQKIEKFNRLRQEIQERVFRQAIRQIGEEKIITVYNPDWHLGVLGLVASKLVQEKGKIAFCLSREGEYIKGSGRSLPEISLIDILQKSKNILEGYGGHSMACGISMKENKLKDFKENLEEIFRDYEFKERETEIEEEINFKDYIEGFPYLMKMEPFGNRNPKPLFITHNVTLLEEPEKINNTYFLKFIQGKEIISGIGFNLDNLQFPKEFSLIYYPSFYNDRISLQFYGVIIK